MRTKFKNIYLTSLATNNEKISVISLPLFKLKTIATKSESGVVEKKITTMKLIHTNISLLKLTAILLYQ